MVEIVGDDEVGRSDRLDRWIVRRHREDERPWLEPVRGEVRGGRHRRRDEHVGNAGGLARVVAGDEPVRGSRPLADEARGLLCLGVEDADLLERRQGPLEREELGASLHAGPVNGEDGRALPGELARGKA